MRKVAVTGIVAAAGATLALAWTGIAGGRDQATTLRGTVGPGFTISLTRNGRRVTRLAPGTYRLVVADRSAIHNFKLEKSAGGFERSVTSIAFKGSKSITVRLTSGSWEYYCQPHESSMKGHFTVAAAGAAPGTTTTDDASGDDHGGYGTY
jgi:plastocyanin